MPLEVRGLRKKWMLRWIGNISKKEYTCFSLYASMTRYFRQVKHGRLRCDNGILETFDNGPTMRCISERFSGCCGICIYKERGTSYGKSRACGYSQEGCKKVESMAEREP